MHPMCQDKDVDIRLVNEIPVANPDPITLSKTSQDRVLWDNHLHEKITITFPNGSPFEDNDEPYILRAREKRSSAKIKQQLPPQPWKYTIKTESGKVHDPQVIIQD